MSAEMNNMISHIQQAQHSCCAEGECKDHPCGDECECEEKKD